MERFCKNATDIYFFRANLLELLIILKGRYKEGFAGKMLDKASDALELLPLTLDLPAETRIVKVSSSPQDTNEVKIWVTNIAVFGAFPNCSSQEVRLVYRKKEKGGVSSRFVTSQSPILEFGGLFKVRSFQENFPDDIYLLKEGDSQTCLLQQMMEGEHSLGYSVELQRACFRWGFDCLEYDRMPYVYLRLYPVRLRLVD